MFSGKQRGNRETFEFGNVVEWTLNMWEWVCGSDKVRQKLLAEENNNEDIGANKITGIHNEWWGCKVDISVEAEEENKSEWWLKKIKFDKIL